jgi:hypothetical protein
MKTFALVQALKLRRPDLFAPQVEGGARADADGSAGRL